MTSLVRCCSLALVVSSITLARSGAAQMKVEVGAMLGYYSPMGSFDPASVRSTALPNDPNALSGAAIGGQLRLWMTPRIGVQLAATTTSSSFGTGASPEAPNRPPVGGTLPIDEITSVSARVSAATAQLLYQVLGADHGTRVWLSAGGAVVRHAGEAYAPYGNPVNYGGVVGLGSTFRIKGPLSAELGLTTMIYRMNLRGSSETDPEVRERGTQADALFHTGVSYSWH